MGLLGTLGAGLCFIAIVVGSDTAAGFKGANSASSGSGHRSSVLFGAQRSLVLNPS